MSSRPKEPDAAGATGSSVDPSNETVSEAIDGSADHNDERVSEVDTTKDPANSLLYWVKSLSLWKITMLSASVQNILKKDMTISYLPTSEPIEHHHQASLAQTLEEMEKHRNPDDAVTSRETLRALARQVKPSSKQAGGGGHDQKLLDILTRGAERTEDAEQQKLRDAEEQQKDKEWRTLSGGKVHCESKLAWRMDSQNDTSERIEVGVSVILLGK